MPLSLSQNDLIRPIRFIYLALFKAYSSFKVFTKAVYSILTQTIGSILGKTIENIPIVLPNMDPLVWRQVAP